ncbi:MAG: hypothetical protein AAF587_28755 [Bacteroidota bacterium]
MKKPITDRMYRLQSLITQVLGDMNYLLEHYSEDEARPYIELLAEISRSYCQTLKYLGDRLEAQHGYDFEI